MLYGESNSFGDSCTGMARTYLNSIEDPLAFEEAYDTAVTTWRAVQDEHDEDTQGLEVEQVEDEDEVEQVEDEVEQVEQVEQVDEGGTSAGGTSAGKRKMCVLERASPEIIRLFMEWYDDKRQALEALEASPLE